LLTLFLLFYSCLFVCLYLFLFFPILSKAPSQRRQRKQEESETEREREGETERVRKREPLKTSCILRHRFFATTSVISFSVFERGSHGETQRGENLEILFCLNFFFHWQILNFE
jgi:hypothetical protein